MKLFGLFVAAVSASGEGDRAFADRPDFIYQEVPSWWNDPLGRSQNLKDQSDRYFNQWNQDDTPKGQKNAARRVNRHIKRTMDENERLQEKCAGKGRKRRATERAWQLDLNKGVKQTAEDLFWSVAAWTRNELFDNCPQQTKRILKRVDRLRHIWFWHTCHRNIDPNGSQCGWISEKNPRYNKNHKFQKENNTPFYVVGCQGKNAEMVCPYGGTIKVSSAAYGREFGWECKKKGAVLQGSTDKCWKNRDQFNDEVAAQCDGGSTCSFGYSNFDLCPGIDKYIRVIYSCE